MEYSTNDIRADIVNDDIDRILALKMDFINLLNRSKGCISPEAFNEYAIQCEQTFDEMLFDTLDGLSVSIGIEEPLPKSAHYQAWLDKTRIKPVSSLRDDPLSAFLKVLNTDTYSAIVNENINASKSKL